MHGLWECVWCADLFVEQQFCSIWHQVEWMGSWNSLGGWLYSPGCRYVPAFLWGDFVVSLSDDGRAGVVDAFRAASRCLDNIQTLMLFDLKIWLVGYALQSSKLVKLIPIIPKPCFLTCICQFLMILFLTEFMINVTTLILKLSSSHFWIVMFLAVNPMESISLNSFVLLEHLAMLLTSTHATNCKLRNLLNKAISVVDFVRLFLNFIDDTMI